MSMTMEQAIKILKSDLAIQKEFKALPDHIEALEMVIQFIEQESCGKDINVSTTDAIKPSRFEFDEEQEQLDFVQQHNKIPVTLTVGDLISRQAVINIMANTNFWLSADNWKELMEAIDSVPSIHPQPKTGHWIKYGKVYQCSECEELSCCQGKFCNECGTKMVELQESEDK